MTSYLNMLTQTEDSCDDCPFLVELEELAELSMGVSLSSWGQDVLDERCDEFESAVGEGVDWSVLGRQSCGVAVVSIYEHVELWRWSRMLLKLKSV